MKKLIISLMVMILCACHTKESAFEMRGVVLSVHDLETVDWPRLATKSGINTIGTHVTPKEVEAFITSERGKTFLADCQKYGIQVEHQLHAIHELLPRELFSEDSTMFRMDENGNRIADFNCCASSSNALDIIAKNAVYYARLLPSTNHRYYYWLDDGAPLCACPQCSCLSGSEQALMIENRMIQELRTFDPEAQLAHLAYHSTLEAPVKVKPAEGVFLEFAPFYRNWKKPLSDESASGRGMAHAENLRCLKENLEVFPAETAVVLEYWLDVSLFSDWKKPAVKLPWHKDVFMSDLNTYAGFGIKNITSFAVYMDDQYWKQYPDQSFLREYGKGMKYFK
ncbi:DUF4838 domain-containing protein [Parabacteroides bouchesdurhonensis]|uniref:DUF4838 domain-containing protein n=1 Tax=Parabacteroides bouchesdurhonensis TaxID=1936995 RepID=UPI000C858596|nr:DUF4838 domain-containing protein [Parabacteroides bouchesdurhonensis]